MQANECVCALVVPMAASYICVPSFAHAGAPVTVGTEETRVFEKKAEGWKLVHLHRSPCSK
jgi:ketosteroid isomerase-like protein